MDWKKYMSLKMSGEVVVPECDFCDHKSTALVYEGDGTPSPRCENHKEYRNMNLDEATTALYRIIEKEFYVAHQKSKKNEYYIGERNGLEVALREILKFRETMGLSEIEPSLDMQKVDGL